MMENPELTNSSPSEMKRCLPSSVHPAKRFKVSVDTETGAFKDIENGTEDFDIKNEEVLEKKIDITEYHRKKDILHHEKPVECKGTSNQNENEGQHYTNHMNLGNEHDIVKKEIKEDILEPLIKTEPRDQTESQHKINHENLGNECDNDNIKTKEEILKPLIKSEPRDVNEGQHEVNHVNLGNGYDVEKKEIKEEILDPLFIKSEKVDNEEIFIKEEENDEKNDSWNDSYSTENAYIGMQGSNTVITDFDGNLYGLKQIVCEFCKSIVKVYQKKCLYRHYVKHFIPELDQMSRDLGIDSQTGCTLCNKTFKFKSEMYRHLAEVHKKLEDILPENMKFEYIIERWKETSDISNQADVVTKLIVKLGLSQDRVKLKSVTSSVKKCQSFIICSHCKMVVIGSVSYLKFHMISHFKDRILTFPGGITECKNCKNFVKKGQLAGHIGIVHGIAEIVIPRDEYEFFRISDYLSGFVEVIPGLLDLQYWMKEHGTTESKPVTTLKRKRELSEDDEFLDHESDKTKMNAKDSKSTKTVKVEAPSESIDLSKFLNVEIQ